MTSSSRTAERRLGDLREELLEVVEERLGAVGEDGQRGVRAHRPERLLAVVAHRPEDVLDVLKGVPERLLAVEQGVPLDRLDRAGVGHLGERHHVVVEVLAVRLLGGDPVLQLLVVDDPPFDQVDEEHLARFEPPLRDDVLGGDVEAADLRGHHRQAVLGDDEPAGPQAVAVEHAADALAVGELDRRRPVLVAPSGTSGRRRSPSSPATSGHDPLEKRLAIGELWGRGGEERAPTP